MKEFVVLLENIRSLHNVGSIFRTADAAGASKIYLSGITPSPLDRFGRPDPRLAKVALGAEKTVAWEKTSSAARTISALKKDNFMIVALEQDERSISYKRLKPRKNAKIALILGEEVKGIRRTLLTKCDRIIEIPMRGKKESLNVSVAFGIAAFELIK